MKWPMGKRSDWETSRGQDAQCALMLLTHSCALSCGYITTQSGCLSYNSHTKNPKDLPAPTL